MKKTTLFDQKNIVDFFVANFTHNNKKWVGNLLQNDGRDIYLDFKKPKESFSYHFRNDLVAISNDFNNRGLSFDDGFLCSGGQHPRLLRLLIQKRTSFQTIIVLDHFLSFSKNWDKEITEKVVWPKISSTIAKLKSFVNFNITECKLIMKEVFVNG
jgi:type I restriction-modification system DNA methylase subunit